MGLNGWDDFDPGPDAKVLRVRPPAPALPPPAAVVPVGEPAAPGRLIVDFFVHARPVPWSVPREVRRIGRPTKSPSLARWQDYVRRAAREAMRGRGWWTGPALFEATFYLRPRPGSMPDLCNLSKAAEDACEGIVIGNDRHIVEHRTRRVVAAEDGARIRVYALEG